MWMLANRLSTFDYEAHISDTAAPVLKSARITYATNCVTVSPDHGDVVCSHGEDWIRLHDMTPLEGFELIQNVFDFYDDWYSSLCCMAEEQDYDGIIDSCWPILNNPIVLLNGNRQLLSLSRRYGPDELDDEWKFLWEFGYASVSAIHKWMDHDEISITRPGTVRFAPPSRLRYGGISTPIFFNGSYVGRLNILEKDRKINQGDFQIAEIICGILAKTLGEDTDSEEIAENIFILNALLSGKHVEREIMTLQMGYLGWQVHDEYQLYLLELDISSEAVAKGQVFLQMLHRTVQKQMIQCIVTIHGARIVILHNRSRSQDWTPAVFLDRIAETSHFRYAVSLPLSGIYHCTSQLDQTDYALKSVRFSSSDTRRVDFSSFALDYILESPSLETSAKAAHPDIVMLWKKKWELNDEMFLTIKEYLNNDRSLVGTAQALFIHRNTLVYRLKKIESLISADTGDLYTRDYMKLSIRILELIEQRCAAGRTELNAENAIGAAFPDSYPGLP